MSKPLKTLDKVLRGNADANIRFGDLCNMLTYFGFAMRVKGDHHIFSHDQLLDILNLQPKNGKAKAYQVKQVRTMLTASRLFIRAQPDTDHEKEADDE